MVLISLSNGQGDKKIELLKPTPLNIIFMAHIFRKTSSKKLPQPNREAKNEDYWREHKGIVKCPKCGNVHLKKRWYSSEEDLRGRLKIEKLGIAEKKLCRACKMIEERAFEGEILIEEFPTHHRKELLRLARKFGERAMKRDPQDRIIKIEDKGKDIRILTSENQLAVSIGKQVDSAFKGGDLNSKMLH